MKKEGSKSLFFGMEAIIEYSKPPYENPSNLPGRVTGLGMICCNGAIEGKLVVGVKADPPTIPPMEAVDELADPGPELLPLSSVVVDDVPDFVDGVGESTFFIDELELLAGLLDAAEVELRLRPRPVGLPFVDKSKVSPKFIASPLAFKSGSESSMTNGFSSS